MINPLKKSSTVKVMFGLGYDFKMLSDGKSLVFLDSDKDVTIVANQFFLKSLSVNISSPSVIDVTSLNSGGFKQYLAGQMLEQTLTFDIIINGQVEYKKGGIIRSIFDLYSIQELLSQVENKVNKRF